MVIAHDSTMPIVAALSCRTTTESGKMIRTIEVHCDREIFAIRPRLKASEYMRKRRERGKRRNADTGHPCVKLSVPPLPYQNHPSLISRFIF